MVIPFDRETEIQIFYAQNDGSEVGIGKKFRWCQNPENNRHDGTGQDRRETNSLQAFDK